MQFLDRIGQKLGDILVSRIPIGSENEKRTGKSTSLCYNFEVLVEEQFVKCNKFMILFEQRNLCYTLSVSGVSVLQKCKY